MSNKSWHVDRDDFLYYMDHPVTDEEYVAFGIDYCPACRQQAVEPAFRIEWTNRPLNVKQISCCCQYCNSRWIAIYDSGKLVGYKNLLEY